MTLYLTDNTSAEEIARAAGSGFVHAVKLYPAGATTNSDAGVTDLARCRPALEAMQRHGLPLCVHGEVTDREIDVFDREQVFIDARLIPLRRDFPNCASCFEHITTRRPPTTCAMPRARSAPRSPPTTCSTTATRSSRAGCARTGTACRCSSASAIARRWSQRQPPATRAFSWAPTRHRTPGATRKPTAAAPAATRRCTRWSSMPTAFERAGALDRLEGFASFFGADFYGLPRNTERVRLRREDWQVPETYPFGADSVVPMRAGEALRWRLVTG
jgi:dihydroorotase